MLLGECYVECSGIGPCTEGILTKLVDSVTRKKSTWNNSYSTELEKSLGICYPCAVHCHKGYKPLFCRMAVCLDIKGH